MKLVRNLGILGFCGMGLLSGSSAIAAVTNEAQNVSQTNEKSFFEILSEKSTLSYFGIYRGAALNDLGNSRQPTVGGLPDDTQPQSVENLVTAGARLTPDITLGASAHFNYFPVGSPVGSGQNLQMLDPILYLSGANLVNQNGFNLGTRLSVQLPLTQADSLLKNHLASAISTLWILNYNAAKSPLTLGMVGSVTGYIANAAAAPNVRTYKAVLAPNGSYQITPTVAATLWIDLLAATRNGGTGFLSGMKLGETDIEPGISWGVTKNVTINPFLNIYPSNPTLASTSIQANIIAKAF